MLRTQHFENVLRSTGKLTVFCCCLFAFPLSAADTAMAWLQNPTRVDLCAVVKNRLAGTANLLGLNFNDSRPPRVVASSVLVDVEGEKIPLRQIVGSNTAGLLGSAPILIPLWKDLVRMEGFVDPTLGEVGNIRYTWQPTINHHDQEVFVYRQEKSDLGYYGNNSYGNWSGFLGSRQILLEEDGSGDVVFQDGYKIIFQAPHDRINVTVDIVSIDPLRKSRILAVIDKHKKNLGIPDSLIAFSYTDGSPFLRVHYTPPKMGSQVMDYRFQQFLTKVFEDLEPAPIIEEG